MDRTEIPPLPDEYALFDVDDVDLAFSTAGGTVDKGGRYLLRSPPQYSLVPHEYRDKANTLFFNGGKLQDIGLKPRRPEDAARIYRALNYLLTSYEPSHEQKEATVGFALMKWCEPL